MLLCFTIIQCGIRCIDTIKLQSKVVLTMFSPLGECFKLDFSTWSVGFAFFHEKCAYSSLFVAIPLYRIVLKLIFSQTVFVSILLSYVHSLLQIVLFVPITSSHEKGGCSS